MSFFMLLVVAMGLSVVKESLGRTMLKCQILAGAHFIFGSEYNSIRFPLTFSHYCSFVLRWHC